MWLRNSQCKDVVQDAWIRGSCKDTLYPFNTCMEECRESLTHWNKRNFRHVGKKINALRQKLQVFDCTSSHGVEMERVHETKMDLNKLLLEEEDMWNQRSRNYWLKSGDRNTSFFHTKASNRHKRNSIVKIMDSNGYWVEEEEQIAKVFTNYFGQLFSSSCLVVSEELINAVQPKVTTRMNMTLLQAFHAPEIEKALKQMHPLKAPSPVSMPPLFYQHFWPTVNSVVIQIVLDFLNHGVVLPRFHEKHIVLIPKNKSPERVTNYRPISLCNVIYKLASKVVANWMKMMLKDIVEENQSAFVAKRLITDNTLVTHEVMNHINRKRKGKWGEMALKLDMSKAYYWVEWECLQKIMLKLGFHERWVRIIMQCVSSVTYAIQINRVPRGAIKPTQGL